MQKQLRSKAYRVQTCYLQLLVDTPQKIASRELWFDEKWFADTGALKTNMKLSKVRGPIEPKGWTRWKVTSVVWFMGSFNSDVYLEKVLKGTVWPALKA